MATTHLTWFGVVVEFSDTEITHITNHMNSGAAGFGALTAALLAMQITGPSAVISGIVSALIQLGSALLIGCNSRKNGIKLTVLWVGLPYCRAR